MDGLLLPSEKEMELICRMNYEAVNLYGVEFIFYDDDGNIENAKMILDGNPMSSMLKYVGYNVRDNEAEPVLAFITGLTKWNIDDLPVIKIKSADNKATYRVDKIRGGLHRRSHYVAVLLPYQDPETLKPEIHNDNDYGDKDIVETEDYSIKKVPYSSLVR